MDLSWMSTFSIGKFVGSPEFRYVVMPFLAGFVGVGVAMLSRPRTQRASARSDWLIGFGWNISALLLWCFEAAVAESLDRPTPWAWWTPVVLCGLLLASAWFFADSGWERDEKDQLKIPLVPRVPGLAVSLILGASSLVILYTQMKDNAT